MNRHHSRTIRPLVSRSNEWHSDGQPISHTSAVLVLTTSGIRILPMASGSFPTSVATTPSALPTTSDADVAEWQSADWPGSCSELVLLSPWFGSIGVNLVSQLALTRMGAAEQAHVWTLVTHSLLRSIGWPICTSCSHDPWPDLYRPRARATSWAAGKIPRAVYTPLPSFWARFAGLPRPIGLHGGASLHRRQSRECFAFLVVLVRFISGNQEFNFLLLFLFPVTVRPQVSSVWAISWSPIWSDWLLVFLKIPGTAPPHLAMTPSAHLGGMLAGWLFFRFLYANNGWDRAPTSNFLCRAGDAHWSQQAAFTKAADPRWQ